MIDIYSLMPPDAKASWARPDLTDFETCFSLNADQIGQPMCLNDALGCLRGRDLSAFRTYLNTPHNYDGAAATILTTVYGLASEHGDFGMAQTFVKRVSTQADFLHTVKLLEGDDLSGEPVGWASFAAATLALIDEPVFRRVVAAFGFDAKLVIDGLDAQPADRPLSLDKAFRPAALAAA